MLDDKNILYVFTLQPHEGRIIHRVLLKVLVHPDGVHVLENHGYPTDLEKLPVERAVKQLARLASSQRFELVSRHDLLQGMHPEFINSAESPKVPDELKELIQSEEEKPNVSKFSYHREGQPAPQGLEIHNEIVYLDGHRLSPEEVQRVMDTIKEKKALLRHPEENYYEGLAKIEPELATALGHMRNAVKAGAMPKEALKTMTRQVFSDTMVPSVGNRKAYHDFLSRPKKGVHVHIDMNDFGSINKKHGFEAGDHAIKSGFNAAREAMDEAVGRKYGKLFRVGGDEGMAFVPSKEHAAAFARAFRQKMEALAPIKGTHKISASIGYGSSPEHAEQALISAKTSKKTAAKPLGQADTHIAAHPEFHEPETQPAPIPAVAPTPAPSMALPKSAAPAAPAPAPAMSKLPKAPGT